MATGPSVLIIGLQPQLIDFSSPDYAGFPGLNAAKVQAALDADEAKLNSLGYDAQLCLTDFGETAEAVVSERLKQKRFDCVLIGAGVRTVGKHFLLFEKLVNIVHEHAPQAKICFNTKPHDTAEAVQRWVSIASGL
jgi:hypothetical protein